MADRSANGGINSNPTDIDSGSDETDRTAAQQYGPWVSFYGFLHRSVERQAALFGGSVLIGSLILVRQFYAFASESTRWSGLPSWTVLVGVGLFGFGIGYYVVRDETSCSDCDANFSKQRVGKRPVSRTRQSDGRDEAYIEEVYECGNCGTLSTELYAQPEQTYPRY